ncbi:MAG TPA: HDIG domain-containing protein [Chloroflexaceae bacterium]|nr:HDIG domain-containing protein [Chloroflexaceae bacterium]
MKAEDHRLPPPASEAGAPPALAAAHIAQPSSFYRARQFVAALGARVSAAEQAMAAATLSPAELRLFEAMPPYDQRHCLDVRRTLAEAGHDDALLLRAATFHDCGKVDDRGRPMALGWYVLATLLKGSPGLYLAAARLCGPIRVYAEHASRGALMAERAGSPPEVVATIRHYHDPAPTGRAALLKWADEQN